MGELLLGEALEIVVRSLAVSGTATLLSSTWSIALAYLLVRSSRSSRLLVPFLEALVGVPTVLVGLLLYLLLSSQGPLGALRLLYTPQTIMLGQAILITPLITSVSYRVLTHSWSMYGELALTLGAAEGQAARLVFSESLPGLAAAVMMGFSRAFGELGVALMIGGNIRGYTRVITTAIALEVSRGEFGLALSLGAMLVGILVLISLTLRFLGRLKEQ